MPESTNNNELPDKCHQCGVSTKAFLTHCIHCDAQFKNSKSSKTITEFYRNLITAEKEFTKEKEILEKKIELISSLHIPRWENDTLGFLSLALPSMNKVKVTFWDRIPGSKNNYRSKYITAWRKHCEEIIMDTQSISDESIREIFHAYAKTLGLAMPEYKEAKDAHAAMKNIGRGLNKISDYFDEHPEEEEEFMKKLKDI